VSLASNEAPFGPLPGLESAVAAAAAETHLYPDPAGTDLTSALAQYWGVGPDQISLGTGSVAVCQQAVTAACAPGDEVVFAWRSFEAYPIIARLAHAAAVPVPLLPDARHHLAAMAAAVTDRTRVVFVCTPNNPTGPAVTAAEMARFLHGVPDRVLVVVDEAYFEYGAGAGALDGVRLLADHPNVLVLRTFSKAYGLAGLRVGYGIGSPAVAAALRKVALPFGVSRIAQAAAVAALGAKEELDRRVAATVAERARVIAAARRIGVAVPDSGGNFYWLPLGDSAQSFADDCAAAGVLVRCFPGEGVRVTVGAPADNDTVLAVLARWIGGSDPAPGVVWT
jgi:histidinol-phosphate aminotransferase